MCMGFIYQKSIKGILRVDMFYISLDIDAPDMVGIRYIVLVNYWIFEQNMLRSLLVHNH